MKDKIKEKLPGSKDERDSETTTPVPAAGGTNPHPTAAATHNEKKGILEKIKEKLPGHHNH